MCHSTKEHNVRVSRLTMYWIFTSLQQCDKFYRLFYKVQCHELRQQWCLHILQAVIKTTITISDMMTSYCRDPTRHYSLCGENLYMLCNWHFKHWFGISLIKCRHGNGISGSWDRNLSNEEHKHENGNSPIVWGKIILEVLNICSRKL